MTSLQAILYEVPARGLGRVENAELRQNGEVHEDARIELGTSSVANVRTQIPVAPIYCGSVGSQIESYESPSQAQAPWHRHVPPSTTSLPKKDPVGPAYILFHEGPRQMPPDMLRELIYGALRPPKGPEQIDGCDPRRRSDTVCAVSVKMLGKLWSYTSSARRCPLPRTHPPRTSARIAASAEKVRSALPSLRLR